jgi:hypothetical protein
MKAHDAYHSTTMEGYRSRDDGFLGTCGNSFGSTAGVCTFTGTASPAVVETSVALGAATIPIAGIPSPQLLVRANLFFQCHYIRRFRIAPDLNKRSRIRRRQSNPSYRRRSCYVFAAASLVNLRLLLLIFVSMIFDSLVSREFLMSTQRPWPKIREWNIWSPICAQPFSNWVG